MEQFLATIDMKGAELALMAFLYLAFGSLFVVVSGFHWLVITIVVLFLGFVSALAWVLT